MLGNSIGIIKVIANHETQEIKIVFDEEKIKLQEIKQILGDLGFSVR